MINRFTEAIQRGVDEATSSTSIAYLPGAFDTTQSLIRDLSRIKAKWDIEILEDADGYNIVFEDALNIVVPKQYFEDFNTKVLKVAGVKQVDLSGILNETIKEVSNNASGRLLTALTTTLKKSDKVAKTTTLMNQWLRTFRNTKFAPADPKVAIRLNNYDADARTLAKRLEKLHGGDIGGIDMFVDALEDGRAIGYTEGYDYLVGVKMQSVYEGVNLILEMNINTSMMPSQSVYVDLEEVTEELESYRTVKTLYRRVFPVGQMFEPSVFGNIRDIIDEALKRE